LEVLFVNLLAAMNFADVFSIADVFLNRKKRLENKKR